MTDKTTEALKLALETAEAIVAANWKTWEELATPEEFERWAKSRANHMVAAIREALAEPVKQGPVAWDLAEKVRRDLDRQSCPGVYMNIAVESIVKNYAAAIRGLK